MAPAPRANTRPQTVIAASILGFYLLLSLSTLFTARPQTDESVYANPGYNLAYNGQMGTTLHELRGFMPLSMAQHTYWQPPLYFVTSAAWYRIAGFGLFQVRLLSVLFGLLALYSWFTIGRSLYGSATPGLMIAGLISVDYFFVLGASQGRMDMMCAAFGVAAIAVYLRERQRSLKSAIFWSHTLATLSVLTHPVGLSYWLGLVILILYFDRRLLSFKLLLLAASPCLAGALGWGIYIAQDPSAFFAQMHGILELNKRAFENPGLSKIPVVRSIQQELQYRYAGPFGLEAGVGLANRFKAVILLLYIGSMVGLAILSRKRRALLLLPVLTIMAFFYLALASPSKFSYYLPHSTMFMAACLGVFLFHAFPEMAKARHRILTAGTIILAAGIQAAGLFYHVHQNLYSRSFVPAVEAIARASLPRTLVFGSGELWFRLQPDRSVLDDPALGYRNGMKPSIFVMDPLYRMLLDQERQAGTELYPFVRSYLDTARLVYEDGYYQVYVR